jgi:hypothetical protein
MTTMLCVLIAALACAAFSVAAYAGGPFGIIHVGVWQGAAYTNDKGAFSHCTAVGKLEKGPEVILAQNADRTWIIGVADPSWQVRDRDSLTLILIFDNKAKFEIAATAGQKRRSEAFYRRRASKLCETLDCWSPPRTSRLFSSIWRRRAMSCPRLKTVSSG